MANQFLFEKPQFNRLFPFYILFNKNLIVVDCGDALQKAFPHRINQAFAESYLIKHPTDTLLTFSFLKSITGQPVIIECLNDKKTNLSGQLEYLAETDELVFLGSPWFKSIKEVTENNLTIDDFANHDPMIDLLSVLKTQEITSNNLKESLQIVNRQKEELKKANKEYYDIVLFPNQNPDPLIRINLEGKILTRNPAAELLEVFEYDNNIFSYQNFFSHIAPIINSANKRWIFEAKSCGKDFSFLCNTILEEGYINIYGRDITQFKKDQEELETLSYILRQISNAVIITNIVGEIEWVNKSFTTTTGYTLQEVKGKTPGSILQGKDTDQVTVHFMREKIRKAEPVTCEILNYNKAGEPHWLRLNIEPIFDIKGKLQHFFGIEEDITKKKSIENELEASASRMSSLINHLQAGVLLEGADRKISLVNTRFCELFDISMDSWELIDFDCGVSTELSKVKFVNPEEYITRADKIFWDRKAVIGDKLELLNGKIFKRNFIPIWNHGIYEGSLWIFNDVTERLTAIKKLEDQKIFYEEILDNIPSDIAVFDSSHHYLYLNPKAIKDPELRKWMVGKTDEDYLKYKNLSKNILAHRRSIFNAVTQSKQMKSWEEKSKKPDGSSIYNLRNMYPVLDEHQEIKIVIGYGLDITNMKTVQHEIKKSEKRYRDVIDNSMAIITTHNLKGDILTVNPMVGKTYGYEDIEMIGHNITEFMLEEDKQSFADKYLTNIFKEKHANGMFRVVGKKGNIIYTLYNNYLKEEEGKTPYIIGFSIDITDRIKAEKELIAAKKITEELAKTKQNFLANMSHEIRTPMNAIMGMANQLGKTSLNPTQQFYLHTIDAASENLLVIINDILDLSKIEAGKLSFENIGFEPQLIIMNAMQVLMHRAEEKGIKIVNSYLDPKVAKVLIGDPYRLNQVILNLISNAIKFTEQGCVELNLTVLADNEQSQLVQIQIKDSGIGMEQEFIEHLFDKFSQEYESTTRRYGGTGLGMSICKNLVELMGGKIFVHSVKGKGTVMSFEIDFKKGTQNDLPLIEAFVFKKDLLAGKTILVVDDNEMNRLVAYTILENYGTKILEASDGNEAVAKTLKFSPDLILMDLQMPILNGFNATAVIRESGNNVPIIALTANAIKGESEKCIAAGMNDYLSKPFREENLLKIIAKCLGIDTHVKKNDSDEVIKEPGEILYDLSNLRAISNGNEVFIKKMITIFCDQTPLMLKDIHEAYLLKDFNKIGAVAHKIKPTIDNLSINALTQIIRDIETAGKENRELPNLQSMLLLLNEILEKVINKMHQEFIDL